MKLIRNQHFREYVEGLYIKSHAICGGLGSIAAKDKFNETMYDDFNLLAWILDGTFPFTHREEDHYVFETDNMQHVLLDKKQSVDVGHCHIRIINGKASLKFDLKNFVHGHARNEDGTINCYGNYLPFANNVVKIGIASALMDAYNFARVSKYETVLPKNAVVTNN